MAAAGADVTLAFNLRVRELRRNSELAETGQELGCVATRVERLVDVMHAIPNFVLWDGDSVHDLHQIVFPGIDFAEFVMALAMWQKDIDDEQAGIR